MGVRRGDLNDIRNSYGKKKVEEDLKIVVKGFVTS